MMLDQYKQDFSSLIECMGVMRNYEEAGESARWVGTGVIWLVVEWWLGR